MKITIIGANGTTGREIVSRALAEGHQVVGAVRRPETLAGIEGIQVAKVDLTDKATVEAAIIGSDVVISALGHGGLKASSLPTTLYSESTRMIRSAMIAAGVKRLMVLSSGGVVEDDASPWVYRKIIRRYLINTYLDMARMETILEESSEIEWTSVRLTHLMSGKSKPYDVEDGVMGKGSFKIHFVDVAKFIVKELEARQWGNGYPVLGYRN